jgi:hypothetical protein
MKNVDTRRRRFFLLIRALCVLLYTESAVRIQRCEHASFLSTFQPSHVPALARGLVPITQGLRAYLQSRRRRFPQWYSMPCDATPTAGQRGACFHGDCRNGIGFLPGSHYLSASASAPQALTKRLASAGCLLLGVSCPVALGSSCSLVKL